MSRAKKASGRKRNGVYGAYILCPHCGESVALAIRRPLPKLVRKWNKVDWKKSSTRIAKEIGAPASVVSLWRRKLAPRTLGKRREKKS